MSSTLVVFKEHQATCGGTLDFHRTLVEKHLLSCTYDLKSRDWYNHKMKVKQITIMCRKDHQCNIPLDWWSVDHLSLHIKGQQKKAYLILPEQGPFKSVWWGPSHGLTIGERMNSTLAVNRGNLGFPRTLYRCRDNQCSQFVSSPLKKSNLRATDSLVQYRQMKCFSKASVRNIRWWLWRWKHICMNLILPVT